MKSLIILIIFALVPLFGVSQENETRISPDEYVNRMNALNDSINQLDSLNHLLLERLEALQKDNSKLKEELLSNISQTDSIASLNNEIYKLTSLLDSVEKRYAEDISMAIIRIAAVRLSLKYDKRKVDEALKDFGNIPDFSQEKQKYAWVENLLSNYGTWYNDFKSIIESVLNNQEQTTIRSGVNASNVEKQIKEMEYYQSIELDNCIAGFGREYNIPFLDECIKRALKASRSKDYKVIFKEIYDEIK